MSRKDPFPFLPSMVSQEELLPCRGLVESRCTSSLGAMQAHGLCAVSSGRPRIHTLLKSVLGSALCPSQNHWLCENAKCSPLWQATHQAHLGHGGGPGTGLCSGPCSHRAAPHWQLQETGQGRAERGCGEVGYSSVSSSPRCPRGMQCAPLSTLPSPQSVPSALGMPGVAALGNKIF